MKLLFKKIKTFLNKLSLPKKGEINYAQFEKLESKKYPNANLGDHKRFKHHPYLCTPECFRRR